MPLRRLDISLSAFEAFARLRDLPGAALLHSADPSHPEAGIDILVAGPSHAVSFGRGVLSVGDTQVVTDQPLEALAQWLPLTEYAPEFRTGFVGAFGYALGLDPRRRSRTPERAPPLPDLIGGLYDWSLTFDHRCHEVRLAWRDGTPATTLERVLSRLRRPAPPSRPFAVTGPVVSALTDADYATAFRRIQDYIAAGDCYQVNLARHFAAPFEGAAHDAGWTLFRRLAPQERGPFSAYLETPYGAIVSMSPERLLRFTPEAASTSPIKGTAPRAADPCLDAGRARDLQMSPKDRAENLMIVDLMRNDLGTFCEPGSISVPRLCEVETFGSVFHLVSTVTARPLPGVHPLTALARVLPAGSITGCPKVRATEIIDELEPVARSIYCGAIGYVDAGGLMDTNVAIRTLVVAGGAIHCWGGGGIVADSCADAEAAEIEHKVGRLLQAIRELSSSSAESAS